MYYPVLLLHSWLRWVVLLAGILAVSRAIAGWTQGRPWTLTDDRAGLWFTIALDLQLLVGLLLYFVLSPITTAALQEFGGVMQDTVRRFWAVEHVFGMALALLLAHVGRVRIRKAPADARRHRRATVYFTLALLAVIGSIPWPGLPHGRPMVRW